MWGDADTAIGGNRDRFPSTQVSLIASAAGEPLAMERVVALYWKPVYKFIHSKFHKDNEAAKDLTQGFFPSALEREFFQRFDPSKAAFRTYLRLAVERYAATRHEAENRQKRGGGVEFAELDAQPSTTPSPEEIFLREWRRQLLTLAIEDLCGACERAGKHTEWLVFEAYDLAEGERPSYAELARRHGVAETSVTNYLAWARRRLRGFVTGRLRGVTSGERELREEMRRLWN
ncbi:MAG: sigma-70 family RNA polymerase sigma factor [Candidatus Solibacter sp.]|jgi:RNA polymerase sigma factor (sigma-70 family)